MKSYEELCWQSLGGSIFFSDKREVIYLKTDLAWLLKIFKYIVATVYIF